MDARRRPSPAAPLRRGRHLELAHLQLGQRALLAWADGARRDLPWRRTRDPWAVLVSETMLQQTQVARVIPLYLAFLHRWPTPAALAAASPADVIGAWSGLGYNSRAVRLQACATAVTRDHGGRVPATLGELLALPGIGPYTARAVLAFAYEEPVGILDTNAARVLARAFAGRRLAPREAQELADGLVPPDRSWVWNQAVLDLGATTCTARRPACEGCPLGAAGACAWQRAGGSDPAVGTAGASGRQSAFDGSDRQGRGRLVAALRSGPVSMAALPEVIGWPGDPDRAERVAATLVRDGLAMDRGGELHLPS